ncbi:MAG: phospho-sugar mutase [Streptosporangiales bacterium]|nr:phospho-sugar mutase [Streptosporangiales bacterium]
MTTCCRPAGAHPRGWAGCWPRWCVVNTQISPSEQTDPDQALIDRARTWLDDDPDPDTRAELRELIVMDDLTELHSRFDTGLSFGTAGLRGALGAGPNRMNRVVVQRAAAGLAGYLRQAGEQGGTVVIGYDARYKSEAFASDTADVLAGLGLTPVVLPRPLPTPVLAYAIRHQQAVAGVMVTASHNPAADSGYKVYLGDGRQIAPPADAEIAAMIEKVPQVTNLPKNSDWAHLDDTVVDDYVERVAGLVADESPRRISVAYTPMHGVGKDVLLAALSGAGFAPPTVVAEQAEPDPEFPTLDFPNPEEPGVLDLALATADQVDAQLVIANDPDADRCTAAVRCRDGSYQQLTGDEIGALLAEHLLRRSDLPTSAAPDEPPRDTFATTIVSSTLLSRMAAAHSVPYAETLTGFKWLTRVDGVRYAYEEAIGYCVDPAAVADKDGVSAAVLLCELAATLAAEGRNLVDLLDDLAAEHGVHATSQLSVRVQQPAEREELLKQLSADPPQTLAGLTVEAIDNLEDTSTGLPATPGLRFRLAEDARIIVRPSGTEPKLKCYLEAVVPVSEDTGVAAARKLAADRLTALADDLATAGGFPAHDGGRGH